MFTCIRTLWISNMSSYDKVNFITMPNFNSVNLQIAVLESRTTELQNEIDKLKNRLAGKPTFKICVEYKFQELHLQPYPYVTNCRDYRSQGLVSREFCFQSCIKNSSLKGFGKVPMQSYIRPNENVTFVIDRLKNSRQTVITNVQQLLVWFERNSVVR